MWLFKIGRFHYILYHDGLDHHFYGFCPGWNGVSKLDQTEAYRMNGTAEGSMADWRKSHELHWEEMTGCDWVLVDGLQRCGEDDARVYVCLCERERQ